MSEPHEPEDRKQPAGAEQPSRPVAGGRETEAEGTTAKSPARATTPSSAANPVTASHAAASAPAAEGAPTAGAGATPAAPAAKAASGTPTAPPPRASQAAAGGAGTKPAVPAAKAAAVPPAGAGGGSEITRRGFFSWLSVAWVAFTGASAIGLAQTARFMFPGIVVEPPLSFKAGFPQEYAPGVDERWKEKYGVWIVREENSGTIYALIAICTHLGCPPNWLPAEEKFKCPCHGSGYYMSGVNFEGPTPRPLERAAISIGEDGQMLVDKGRIFQFEKGQWTDSSSFLKA